LFGVKEMLGARLNTIHNLWFFAKLMEEIRSAVRGRTFQEFRREFHRTYIVDRPTGEGRSEVENTNVS
jgi:queuine tRNA-ribosyltransferase